MELICFIMFTTITMVTSNQDNCPIVSYMGSFKDSDHLADHALLGFSYKNMTVDSHQKCFSICVMDCRCLSYQLSGSQCEIMDEDRHTIASPHFMAKPGYRYYGLRQRFAAEVSGCGTGKCWNGCCSRISCLNGGTCTEKCENVKAKFQCLCRPGFQGKMCEKALSCKSYTGKQSGVYPITLPSGEKLQVYCDLTSEPGHAWTLIESFAYGNNPQYQEKPFLVDYPVNHKNPQWTNYRLSRNHMLSVQSNATLWRATCKFDTDGFRQRDYVKGLLSDMDIMSFSKKGTCARVQHIDIRGQFCSDCTTYFYQDSSSRHPYIDSHYGSEIGCTWSASAGSVYGDTGQDYHSWDDNFGFYLIANPNHRCSSSSSSKTQWWLGDRI